MTLFFQLLLFLLASIATLSTPAQSQRPAQPVKGAFVGAKVTAHPDWFKESFLDFEEDIAAATAQGKRLIVYFSQNGCPYCNRLVEDNFSQPDIVATTRRHFDLVMLNMWGDREVIHVGGQTFSEKELAAALAVSYTPTLLFFDHHKHVVLRLNGYYPPDQFRLALEYVHTQQQDIISFGRFLELRQPAMTTGNLNQAEWLMAPPFELNALENGKPLLVLFEHKGCELCDKFHHKTMAHDLSKQLISGFNAVQLDRFSDTTVTTPSGVQTSARKWANDLGISFSPSLVFFDNQGQQVIKAETFFKTFHLQGVMAYVLEQAYRTEPNFQRYLGARAEQIQAMGVEVDIWSY